MKILYWTHLFLAIVLSFMLITLLPSFAETITCDDPGYGICEVQAQPLADTNNNGGLANNLITFLAILAITALIWLLIYGILFGIPLLLIYFFIVKPLFKSLVRATSKEWKAGQE